MKKLTINLTFLFLLICNISFAKDYQQIDETTKKENQATINTNSFLYDELVEIVDVSPELELEGRKPLLLIHGWSFEGRPAPPGGGYWNNFKDYLMNDPVLRANFKPYYVKYWSNAVPIVDIAAELRNKVEEAGFHEQKIAIIAHSMGGLVSRSYMNEHTFTQGVAMNEKCGELVDQLITLGSPHHGSPMANGPARNAEVSVALRIYMSSIETFVFKETSYDQVNRSDLRWDNYDDLMDYNTYSDEVNTWLTNLNSSTEFDLKTICYTASVQGQFIIPSDGNLEEQYKLGAWFQKEGFNFNNDGIVPVQSAGFEGHTMKNKRHFDNYNHADIIRGKEDKMELFGPLGTDLMDVAPLKLTWPNFPNTSYIKHYQYRDIKWQTLSTVNQINIYLSIDNGQTFQTIATNIDASLGKYSWFIPDINASHCLIKIENSEFENENSISQVPFTIFHNNINVTYPSVSDYVVRSNTNTIEWEQEGIGNKVKITYTDSKNDIQKIIADEVETSTGHNSFIWNADETLIPTDEAVITIQLLDLYDNYGDSQTYKFSSSEFQVFGEPNFTLLSPETNPIDYMGIEGEQLGIESIYSIKWKAEGEINFIGFYLCDKDKNIIEPITNVTNSPAVLVEKNTRWRVPEYYGDQFYIYAKAGYSSDSILFETFSDNSFRINIKAEILSPGNNSLNVSLQPCFEVKAIDNANRYEFMLIDTLNNQYYWEYESDTNGICITPDFENELLPGANYSLTAWALIDTFKTFSDKIFFTAEQTSPWEFSIINPVESDSTEEVDIDITWTRSVGASSYSVQLFQMNDLINSIDILNKADTTCNIDISELEFYENIEIVVTANNAFGSTIANTSIIKKFKTGIDFNSNSEYINQLKNYPNPFSAETTFEFYLPKRSNHTQITLYDLSGKKLGIIASGSFERGINKVRWERSVLNGNQIGKGIYLYQMKSKSMVRNRLLQVY